MGTTPYASRSTRLLDTCLGAIPGSLRTEYRRRVGGLPPAPHTSVVTEDDLAGLPEAVARYIHRSGAVGRPRVTDFRARFHGRIRGGPRKPWMRFTGQQTTTVAPACHRLFLLDARAFGLPLDVLHVFDGSASMRAKVFGLVSIIDAAGEAMDRSETVTFFNDLCVMAPAALIDLPVSWRELQAHRIHGSFTNGAHTVTAVLTFDDVGDLVDFVSDDRSRGPTDGSTFANQRWSTPVGCYGASGGRRLARIGTARWHAPEPEGTFTYIELEIDDIAFDQLPRAPTLFDRRDRVLASN